MNKMLREEKIYCLKAQEEDLDRRIKDEDQSFKVDSQMYLNRIDDSEIYRERTRPKLQRLEKKLAERKAVMDKEKQVFIEEAERLEAVV